MDDIDRIRNNDFLTKKQKAKYIIDFLDKDRIVCKEGIYYYRFLDEDIPVLLKSTSIIKVKNNPTYSENNNSPLQQYYQYRQTIERIMRAINSICLKEDRIIFVERMIYQKKIEQIIYQYYLSTRGYYNCYNTALNDFCQNLKITE